MPKINNDDNKTTSIDVVLVSSLLKHVSAILYQIFIYHQMIALQKLWKMFFISFKKLFLLSRYSDFCIFVFPSFAPCQPLLKINLTVYCIISCLNKNLIVHFVWHLEMKKRYEIETLSIDRALNKEHFYGKIMQIISNKS